MGLWLKQCTTLWSRVLPFKFCSFRAFPSNLTSGWTWWPPYMTFNPLWPHLCITLWSGILPIKFGSHRAFLSNFIPGWPRWPLYNLQPQQCDTLQSRVLSALAAVRHFLGRLTSGWPLTWGRVASKRRPQTSGGSFPRYQVTAWCVKALQNT